MYVFKARRVIDWICGCSYEESFMIVELMPYRASYPILKLFYSATANASHNTGLDEANLFISKAEVNGGDVVKKLCSQARGCSYPIKRPTSHITIILKDNLDHFKMNLNFNIFSRRLSFCIVVKINGLF